LTKAMKTDALEMEPPYRDVLSGILAFATFDEAAQTIRRLENLCREYRSLSDKKGVEYCRRIAQLGRRRAEAISRNGKVSQRKRLQKQEIANWFRIWLETPALFEDWLSMRQSTEAFQRLVDPESGQAAGGHK
jgi:hypothetical protein